MEDVLQYLRKNEGSLHSVDVLHLKSISACVKGGSTCCVIDTGGGMGMLGSRGVGSDVKADVADVADEVDEADVVEGEGEDVVVKEDVEGEDNFAS